MWVGLNGALLVWHVSDVKIFPLALNIKCPLIAPANAVDAVESPIVLHLVRGSELGAVTASGL